MAGKYDYDVVVLGGGPGGYVAAIKAAQSGLKTAVIEKDNLGGTCLNVGCIPTKTFVKTVGVLKQLKRSREFCIENVDVSSVSVSMEKLQERKQSIVRQLVGGVNALLKGNKAEVIKGCASFENAHCVKAGNRRITSEYFIIATGSEVLIPGFIEYEGDTKLITSTEALELCEIPESMNIIGGGVIGIEFAYIFSQLGTKVTVLELMDNILPMVDTDISRLARKTLEKAGVVFETGAKVKKVSGKTVVFEKDGAMKEASAQLTLMAVGRTPYTKGLNAEGIGLEFDKKAIKAGPDMRTNIPNIFAIGDVNGKSMLAHTASHEGIVAVANIMGGHEQINYGRVPSCIYMEPEIASVGLTEAKAREQYKSVRVGRFPMSANGKSLIEGEKTGMMKVILDGEYGEILGVHLFAVHATDMISEICVAMELEATAEEVIHSIHPHPTVSEAVAEAFMAACDRALHSL